MRHLPWGLLLACGAAGAQEPLYIASSIPIAEDADINPAILADCPVQQDFADTLRRSLSAFNAQQVDKLDTARKGRVLQVEIVDLSTSGNGFIGRQNYVRVRGTLFQDGRKVASFFDKAPVRAASSPAPASACAPTCMPRPITSASGWRIRWTAPSSSASGNSRRPTCVKSAPDRPIQPAFIDMTEKTPGRAPRCESGRSASSDCRPRRRRIGPHATRNTPCVRPHASCC